MSPPFDSIDVIVGSIVSRLEKSEGDINELHKKQRLMNTQADQLLLHSEDFRNRLRVLEAHDQSIFDSHHDVSKRVEMMESKLDDMKSNVTKIVEGQMQILNSNTSTREEFSSLLTAQSKQHLDRMKRIRHIIYIGGGFLIVLTQIWSAHTGQNTIIDSVLKFIFNQTT